MLAMAAMEFMVGFIEQPARSPDSSPAKGFSSSLADNDLPSSPLTSFVRTHTFKMSHQNAFEHWGKELKKTIFISPDPSLLIHRKA